MRAAKPSVGILGGGQLGCMLAEAARALQAGGHVGRVQVQAAPGDPAWALHPDLTAATLAPDLDRYVFENEFLDCDALEARFDPARFRPALAALRPLQDKLEQKRLLAAAGIPSARAETLASAAELPRIHAALGPRLVLKWSRQGYDGKGVRLVQAGAPDAGLAEFLAGAAARGAAVYAEECVDFARELAVVACAAPGFFATYPLVVSEQRQGVCWRVRGPAAALGAPPALEAEAREFARRLAASARLTGVFALELFETRDGRLLANEIAPRVHNSGHFTLDACPLSQFEAHLRACLGLPLAAADFAAARPFAMLNLLGPEGLSGTLPAAPPFAPPPPGLRLHWYGKSAVRPGRKVGHLNAVAAETGGAPGEAISVLEDRLSAYHGIWLENLRGLAK